MIRASLDGIEELAAASAPSPVTRRRASAHA
jgi:hypothetical protein